MAVLTSSVHVYGAVMKYRDLLDLANFVSYGQFGNPAYLSEKFF